MSSEYEDLRKRVLERLYEFDFGATYKSVARQKSLTARTYEARADAVMAEVEKELDVWRGRAIYNQQRRLEHSRRADLADAVTAEWKKLLERRTGTLRRRAERAEAAIERVKQLHRMEHGECVECMGESSAPWPCATIRALEGQE